MTINELIAELEEARKSKGGDAVVDVVCEQQGTLCTYQVYWWDDQAEVEITTREY